MYKRKYAYMGQCNCLQYKLRTKAGGGGKSDHFMKETHLVVELELSIEDFQSFQVLPEHRDVWLKERLAKRLQEYRNVEWYEIKGKLRAFIWITSVLSKHVNNLHR